MPSPRPARARKAVSSVRSSPMNSADDGSRPSASSSQHTARPLSQSMSGRSSNTILPRSRRRDGCARPTCSTIDSTAPRAAGAASRTCVATLNRLRSTSTPAMAAVARRSSRSAASSCGRNSRATSRRGSPARKPVMSSPWLPTYAGPSMPTRSATTATSRPDTTATGSLAASRPTVSRIPSDNVASSGRATIGVNVPS